MKKHGGKRKGAGAKNKYGELTVTISFRVPRSKVVLIKKIFTDYIALFENPNPSHDAG